LAADALLTDEIPGATVVTGFLIFFFQLERCRVIATATALIVVNPIRRYVFRWSQIADVAVGRDGGLRLMLCDRSSFAVYGFGGSVMEMITGGIHAKKARDGINAVMSAAAVSQIQPGPTALTVIPCPAASTAAARVRPTMPALAVA
jgi:Bacterial PH domain